MNEQEKAIWNAAYGAAFVTELLSARELAESIPSAQRQGELPTDFAIRLTSAEQSGYFADLAVQRFRDWRKEENPKLGDEVP